MSVDFLFEHSRYGSEIYVAVKGALYERICHNVVATCTQVKAHYGSFCVEFFQGKHGGINVRAVEQGGCFHLELAQIQILVF